MGARRNDDSDLELRDDFHHPLSPAPAVTPNNNNRSPAPADSGVVEQQTPSKSGLASYIPFSYFGLTSPAPAATDDRQNSIGNKHTSNKQNGSHIPPLGAFPPSISSSHNENGHAPNIGEDGILDNREQGADLQHYNSSHPWFNKFDMNEMNDNNQPNDNGWRNELAELPNAKKKDITWKDRKAIIATTFNFTNAIIGAGAMGLGGAFAASGGLISICSLLAFAWLTKLSLDLIVDLSSCPSIIRKARSLDVIDHDKNHREMLSDLESISSSGESERKELSTNKNNPFGNILNDIDESKTKTENGQSNQGYKPPNMENTNTPNSSSPLMAQEEEQDENDLDHPLVQEAMKDKDRYDSLTMDVTQPRHFSPLNLNADGSPPIVNSTSDIQNDNNLVQPPQDNNISPCTYEELGRAAFGNAGRLSVLISKALYSFGCLIAYVVVVRDNFGLALRRIIGEQTSPDSVKENGSDVWYDDDDFLAFWVSALFMLPLSCPRTMKPLAKFSFVSILSIIFLVIVVIILFFTCTNPEGGIGKASFYENWIEVRSFSGFVESLGCFVFTFVCHHTVNLAYESLPPQLRNPKVWRRVSTNSIALAAEASLAIGVFAYATFGAQTPADVLMGYPSNINLVNIARLLLCLTMVLTFPLPFLTCREMTILICLDMHKFYYMHGLNRLNIFGPISVCYSGAATIWTCIRRRWHTRQNTPMQRVVDDGDEVGEFVQMQHPSFFRSWRQKRRGYRTTNEGFSDPAATQALITSIGGERGKEINPSPLSSRSGDPSSDSETTISSIHVPTPSWILDDRQLSLPWHAALTFTLWLIVTICAIKSPSLGDVLDLVGAFTGTLIAFVLPALFSFKLKGYSNLSLIILAIGGFVGLLGTVYSFIKFTRDIAG